jgi:hypothetical protein
VAIEAELSREPTTSLAIEKFRTSAPILNLKEVLRKETEANVESLFHEIGDSSGDDQKRAIFSRISSSRVPDSAVDAESAERENPFPAADEGEVLWRNTENELDEEGFCNLLDDFSDEELAGSDESSWDELFLAFINSEGQDFGEELMDRLEKSDILDIFYANLWDQFLAFVHIQLWTGSPELITRTLNYCGANGKHLPAPCSVELLKCILTTGAEILTQDLLYEPATWLPWVETTRVLFQLLTVQWMQCAAELLQATLKSLMRMLSCPSFFQCLAEVDPFGTVFTAALLPGPLARTFLNLLSRAVLSQAMQTIVSILGEDALYVKSPQFAEYILSYSLLCMVVCHPQTPAACFPLSARGTSYSLPQILRTLVVCLSMRLQFASPPPLSPLSPPLSPSLSTERGTPLESTLPLAGDAYDHVDPTLQALWSTAPPSWLQHGARPAGQLPDNENRNPFCEVFQYFACTSIAASEKSHTRFLNESFLSGIHVRIQSIVRTLQRPQRDGTVSIFSIDVLNTFFSILCALMRVNPNSLCDFLPSCLEDSLALHMQLVAVSEAGSSALRPVTSDVTPENFASTQESLLDTAMSEKEKTWIDRYIHSEAIQRLKATLFDLLTVSLRVCALSSYFQRWPHLIQALQTYPGTLPQQEVLLCELVQSVVGLTLIRHHACVQAAADCVVKSAQRSGDWSGVAPLTTWLTGIVSLLRAVQTSRELSDADCAALVPMLVAQPYFMGTFLEPLRQSSRSQGRSSSKFLQSALDIFECRITNGLSGGMGHTVLQELPFCAIPLEYCALIAHHRGWNMQPLLLSVFHGDVKLYAEVVSAPSPRSSTASIMQWRAWVSGSFCLNVLRQGIECKPMLRLLNVELPKAKCGGHMLQQLLSFPGEPALGMEKTVFPLLTAEEYTIQPFGMPGLKEGELMFLAENLCRYISTAYPGTNYSPSVLCALIQKFQCGSGLILDWTVFFFFLLSESEETAQACLKLLQKKWWRVWLWPARYRVLALPRTGTACCSTEIIWHAAVYVVLAAFPSRAGAIMKYKNELLLMVDSWNWHHFFGILSLSDALLFYFVSFFHGLELRVLLVAFLLDYVLESGNEEFWRMESVAEFPPLPLSGIWPELVRLYPYRAAIRKHCVGPLGVMNP